MGPEVSEPERFLAWAVWPNLGAAARWDLGVSHRIG